MTGLTLKLPVFANENRSLARFSGERFGQKKDVVFFRE